MTGPEVEALWPVELREHAVQCRHVSCRVKHWNVNGYCDGHQPARPMHPDYQTGDPCPECEKCAVTVEDWEGGTPHCRGCDWTGWPAE